jgi:hydrogenase nickel incorporation protein HypB
MCATCGCADGGRIRHQHDDGTWHEHGAHQHDHAGPGHGHQQGHGRTVTLEEKVLARNDTLARQNRDWLRGRDILALNLMSSPGAGKTTLLERTARDLAGELAIGVIEGDQETALDADRMRAAGCRVVQVNTGTGCHLDALMVREALTALDPPDGSVVVIENVGNLVCPALFDLGEAHRVVLASVTEGADKPVKYPHMFRTADLVLVSKTDLLPYLDFDLARCTADLGTISPAAAVLPVSARAGDGIGRWYDWLRQRVPARALLARGSTVSPGGHPRTPDGPEPPDDRRPRSFVTGTWPR